MVIWILLAPAYADDDKIAWFENNGASDPSFTSRTIAMGTSSVNGAWSVYAADMDSDGDIDIYLLQF